MTNKSVLLCKQCHEPDCIGTEPQETELARNPSYFIKCWDAANQLFTSTGRRYNICILEITDECEISCETCIASCGPGCGNTVPAAECISLIQTVAAREPIPDILMLSGGEPCIHPQFESILDAAVAESFPHVMVISNGVRIAEDENFAKIFSRYGNHVEIYLQFDSLNQDSLLDIRGLALRQIRLDALKHLEKYNIPTTLVCVVKKGVNDTEINELVEIGLQYRCVRGVTFQPIRSTGRHDNFDKEKHRIQIDEIIDTLVQSDGLFTRSEIIPHPQNPLGVAIAYLSRENGHNRCVTKELYKLCRGLRSTKLQPALSECMYFLPHHDNQSFRYDTLFRVAIVSFLDTVSFVQEQLNTCNIAFIERDLRMMPFDTHYMTGEIKGKESL